MGKVETASTVISPGAFRAANLQANQWGSIEETCTNHIEKSMRSTVKHL